MNHPTKALAILLALVAAFALIACGDDDDATTGQSAKQATETTAESSQNGKEGEESEPPTPTIVIRDAEPVGGVRELTYDAGEEIRFTVRSDVADEIHVHGYDLMKDVAAGGSVTFAFPGDIEGIFEVELEERAEQIAELTVNP
jgi:hypothetical protein